MKKKVFCALCKTREAVEKARQVTKVYSKPKKSLFLKKTKTKLKEIQICSECAKFKLKKAKKKNSKKMNCKKKKTKK
ncbi:MAG: hypothetical protein ABH850_04885 [Candidatus Micrarchaeota archaeon]